MNMPCPDLPCSNCTHCTNQWEKHVQNKRALIQMNELVFGNTYIENGGSVEIPTLAICPVQIYLFQSLHLL